MKKYALILACLAWTLGTAVSYGQTTGGTAGAGTAGGAVGGATGGAAVGGARVTPGTVTPTLPPGTLPPGTPPGTGTQPPLNPGLGTGVGTAGGATVGTGNGVGPGTGATGGVQPGVGASGGIGPGIGGTGGTITDTPTGTTADVQTGVNGLRGAATPGPVIGVPSGATPMNPTDMALAQRVRSLLFTAGNGPGAANTGVGTSTAGGALSPQELSNVQIMANNGVVTLRGRVNTEAERQLLENRIRRMTGVRTVINGVMVAGPNSTSGATGTTTPGGTTLPGVTR